MSVALNVPLPTSSEESVFRSSHVHNTSHACLFFTDDTFKTCGPHHALGRIKHRGWIIIRVGLCCEETLLDICRFDRLVLCVSLSTYTSLSPS